MNVYSLNTSSNWVDTDVNVLAQSEASALRKFRKKYPKVRVNEIKLLCNVHIK